MQVSTDASSALERQITIELPAEQLEQAVEKELRHRSKHMQINGFRPGKAPLALIKQQEGGAIRREIRQQLVQQQLQQFIEQQPRQPVGGVQLIPDPAEIEVASYQASFEIFPEIILQDVSSIEIEKPRINVTEQDVANHIQNMRRLLATWSPVQREAALEDRVIIDFTGTVEGELLENLEEKNFQLYLTDNKLVEGFIEGIIGHQAGEEFSFESTFPSDQGDEELRGKTVQFSVQLKQVESCKLPELTTETLQAWGVEEGTIEQLQLTVSKILEDQLEEMSQKWMRRQLEDELLQLYPALPLPRRVVEERVSDGLSQLKRMGRSTDNTVQEGLRQRMERRVALDLILREVINQRAIEMDETRFFRCLEKESCYYDHPQQLLEAIQKQPEYAKWIRNNVLGGQALDLLLEGTLVTERDYTLAEITKKLSDGRRINKSGM